MTPTWVDSHCHLEMLKGDTDENIESVFSDGMAFCVTIGTDYKSSLKIADQCDLYSRLFGTVGIHPHAASTMRHEDIDQMKKLAVGKAGVVAIGECGFDYYYNRSSKSDQRAAFVTQLDVAVETGLPVVIHARDADRDTREIMASYNSGKITGVFHSFTSDLDQAKWVLDAGFYISFNGICTFPKADAVREVLAYVPLDRILLETDAPFLSPVPVRGKPNYPRNVALVGAFVADFLKMPAERLAEISYQNTLTLFNKIKL